MKKNYTRNIKTYYWYSTFSELLILGPILVMFLSAKGLSFTQIMVLQSISSASVVLFEVPTGAIADKAGRKMSVLLGSIFWAVSLSVYAFGTHFLAFAIAEITFSLGSALKSGADSALIYDSLKMLGREKEFQAIEGKARANSLYAQAVGSIIAGYVYEINILLPMIISAFFMVLTVIITLRFSEPEIIEQEKEDSLQRNNYFHQILESGKYILTHEKIKAITFFSMVFFIFYRAGFWFYQPYMEAVKIPVRYFGIIFFVFNIAAAFSSKRAYYIMDKTKPKTLTFMAALMIVSFIFLGTVKTYFGIAAILFQQLARGIYRPVTAKYLNKHIPSDKRATVLSFNSLLCNIAVTISFPFIGMLQDYASVFNSHLIMAGVMVIFIGITIKYMNGRLGVKPTV